MAEDKERGTESTLTDCGLPSNRGCLLFLARARAPRPPQDPDTLAKSPRGAACKLEKDQENFEPHAQPVCEAAASQSAPCTFSCSDDSAPSCSEPGALRGRKLCVPLHPRLSTTPPFLPFKLGSVIHPDQCGPTPAARYPSPEGRAVAAPLRHAEGGV